MASMVLFSCNGVIAEWHKDSAFTVRHGEGVPRYYQTEEKAITAAKRKAARIAKAAGVMTFAQFQASGVDCDDLGAKLREETLEGAKGRIYCDSLYIESWNDPRGPWLTTIENTQPHGELVTVERELYSWAVSEGYCDLPKESK